MFSQCRIKHGNSGEMEGKTDVWESCAFVKFSQTGWRDGSVVKSTICSLRGSQAQVPTMVAHNCL